MPRSDIYAALGCRSATVERRPGVLEKRAWTLHYALKPLHFVRLFGGQTVTVACSHCGNRVSIRVAGKWSLKLRRWLPILSATGLISALALSLPSSHEGEDRCVVLAGAGLLVWIFTFVRDLSFGAGMHISGNARDHELFIRFRQDWTRVRHLG